MTNKWSGFILNNVPVKSYIERWDNLTDRNKDFEFTGKHHTHTSTGGRCLTVNVDKNVFRCYNCDAKGSVIDYEMDRAGVDFRTACENIARAMGLNLPTDHFSPEQLQEYQTQRQQDNNTLPLLQIAAQYFHEQLTPKHRAYFHSRGFTDATIDSELLGYAPRDEKPLKKRLYDVVKKGDPNLSDNEIRDRIFATGLYTLKDNSTLNPVFRERYIFTYHKDKEQIGYFIGRNASNKESYTVNGNTFSIPKYKKLNTKSPDNSSELPVARYHTLWGAHLLRPDGAPIVVTEGIVDAMLLCQELGDHYQVISPVTTRINSSDIDNILDLLWGWGDGYSTIIFCNDTEKSGVGAGGAMDTVEKLQEQWQARINAEKEACGDSEPPERRNLILKIATLPCPPERDKIDVADYVQMGLSKELRYWLESAQPLWYYHAQARRDPSRFFDKNSFMPKRVTDEIRQQGRYFLFTSGILYEYQGGVYRENENGLRADMQSLLWERASESHIQNGIKHISTDAYSDESEITTSDKINCRNGVIDTETLELLPHSPYTKTLIQINADWNPKAECPAIDTFLDQILPDDCQDLIRQVVGYTIMQSNAYEKAVLLVGSGNNGKSTFLNLVRSFLGKENYVAKSLHTLEENRFASASLFGKLANICGDISSGRIEDTSILKQIVSSDAIDGERKFKGAFTFENFATNYFSCNELPPTSDRSHGFYRRWLLLPFVYQIPDNAKDPDLREKLTTPAELSGLLRCAVEGQKQLRTQRGFSMPKSVNDALSEYQLDNDSVMRFIVEEVDISDPDAESNRSEIYKAYKLYCESQNIRAVSMTAFNKSLVKNEVAKRIDNVRPKKWKGITINRDSEFLNGA